MYNCLTRQLVNTLEEHIDDVFDRANIITKKRTIKLNTLKRLSRVNCISQRIRICL